jgi:hypothetical protein
LAWLLPTDDDEYRLTYVRDDRDGVVLRGLKWERDSLCLSVIGYGVGVAFSVCGYNLLFQIFGFRCVLATVSMTTSLWFTTYTTI